MLLTILVTCPAELAADYLRLYREALLNWNREGLAETQVILLPQGPLHVETDPFEVVEVDFERVDGYPIWDVMKSLRTAWPLVKGAYVSFDHPEFIWGPGRLDRTVGWLRGFRPLYAMGNLRRLGLQADTSKSRDEGAARMASKWLMSLLDHQAWQDGGMSAFELLHSKHWMFQHCPEQPPGVNPWAEDVFYIDRDFFELLGFNQIKREVPFQDIYDLIQAVYRYLEHFGLEWSCVRMPMSVNKLVHLWHPRSWGSWTPQIRDWFLSQPGRWNGTAFLDDELWERLIRLHNNSKSDYEAVNALRFGPDGSAMNYACDIVSGVGLDRLREFYISRDESFL